MIELYLLSDEGGRVVQYPANVAELAGAIAFCFDHQQRVSARNVARQFMEAYPPSRNVEETLVAYYEVAGLKGRDE